MRKSSCEATDRLSDTSQKHPSIPFPLDTESALGMASALIAGVGILSLYRRSEFIYFQF